MDKLLNTSQSFFLYLRVPIRILRLSSNRTGSVLSTWMGECLGTTGGAGMNWGIVDIWVSMVLAGDHSLGTDLSIQNPSKSIVYG